MKNGDDAKTEEDTEEKDPLAKDNDKSDIDKKKSESPKNDKEDVKNDEENDDEPSAITLGEIAKINNMLNKTRVETLQTLYSICFDSVGKSNVVKKNLRNFSGFDFDSDSDKFKKRVEAAQKIDIKQLKICCDVLILDKRGSKEDISRRICEFLLSPNGAGEVIEDQDEEDEMEEEEETPKKETKNRREEKVSKSTTGRPKRSTAGRGYNKDYSSSDESDEKYTKATIKKRRNQSDSGSDV